MNSNQKGMDEMPIVVTVTKDELLQGAVDRLTKDRATLLHAAGLALTMLDSDRVPKTKAVHVLLEAIQKVKSGE